MKNNETPVTPPRRRQPAPVFPASRPLRPWHLPGRLAVLALLLLGRLASAAVPLPLYDTIPSTYANGGDLGAAGAGSTLWTLGTPSTNLLVSSNAALGFFPLQNPPGGSQGVQVALTNALQSIGVNFTSVTNGSVYASFLLKLTALPVNGNIRCVAGLDSKTNYANTPALTIGVNPSGQLVLGRSSATVVSTPTPALTLGQTNLVVARYTFVTGTSNDTVSLWLNPTNLGAAESGVPPATIANYTATNLADATNLQAFFLPSQSSSAGVERWTLDEFRLGTNWAAVTPPDAPVTTIVMPAAANPVFMELNLPGGTPVDFTVQATDQDADLAGVAWYLNGQLQGTYYTLSGASGTAGWSYDFTGAGTNTVQACAVNTQGYYSSVPATWTVTVAPRQRGMYVDQLTNVLGHTAAENSVLEYAKANNFTYLALYVKSNQLNGTLSSFILRAETNYGVTTIGFPGQNTNDFNNYTNYNALYPGKADVLNLEYEYWNQTPRDFTGYLGRLQYLNSLAAAQGLFVEAYVGWPSNSEITQIAGQVDRLLVHCYVKNPTNAYTYGWTNYYRWWYAGLATNRAALWPIFSCESSNNFADQPFMGNWLAASGLNAAETNFEGSYVADTNVMKYNAGILGFQYYSYNFMSPLLFLTATACSPTNLAANVSTNASLVITMNTNVVLGTAGNVTIRRSSDNAVFETIPVTGGQITAAGNLVTITPAGSFAPATGYYVLMDGTCCEYQGAYFPGITVTNAWQFTTH